jgi:hypothetical protein
VPRAVADEIERRKSQKYVDDMLNTNTSQNTVNNIESNKNEKDISVD